MLPYVPWAKVDDVVQLVEGRVNVQSDVEPEVKVTVPVALLESPDSANVAVAPGKIVADDDLFTEIEYDEAESATSFATPIPAVTIAGVAGAAPRPVTSLWPFAPSTNRINAARANALEAESPEVGAIR